MAFDSSNLGTKDHWKHVYDEEESAFDDAKVPGEVWFGERAAERHVRAVRDAIDAAAVDPASLSAIDLGCGNGTLCIGLALKEEHELDEGCLDACEATVGAAGVGRVVGIDYVDSSVSLSQKLLTAFTETHADLAYLRERVSFAQADILEPTSFSQLAGPFQIVSDKGTYDAMSLSPDPLAAREGYRSTLLSTLLAPASPSLSLSLFVITSCNFTHDELTAFFTATGQLAVFRRIPAPSFTFGGVKGQQVSSIIFQRT